MFISILCISMIAFSIFSVALIEHSDPAIFSPNTDVGVKKQSIVKDSSEMGSHGYLDTVHTGQALKRLEPGNYRVTIHSVGENVIIVIRTSKDTVERRFNGTQSCEFTIESGAYLWVGIVVGDAPDVTYNRSTEKLKIHFEKIEEGYHPTSYGLIALGITGGVILAVNTARIHRRERE